MGPAGRVGNHERPISADTNLVFVTTFLRRLSWEQGGSTIIEVLASAAILAVVSTGVLTGLDGAQNQSNHNRLRSVAASLVQADQERLRARAPYFLDPVRSAWRLRRQTEQTPAR